MINIKFNNKQKELLDAIFKKGHNKIFYHGGVRSGKSLSFLFAIDVICQKTPGIEFLVGRKSYESIKTDTHRILKSNPGILDASKGEWKDGGRQFNYYNGSIIYFRHLEGAEHTLGMTLGGIYIEQAELIKKEDYELVRTRLSQWSPENPAGLTEAYIRQYGEYIKEHKLMSPQNYLFLSANPRPSWVKSDFIDKTPKEFYAIHTTTYDNINNLPKKEIEESANQSELFKQRYYLGSWEFAAGLVYPEFTNDNIVGSGFDLKLQFSKLKNFISIDPGYATSKFANIFATVLPDGRLYIYDEIVKNGKDEEEMNKIGVPEIANLIKEKVKILGIPPEGIIDFAANAKIGGGTSITDQFRGYGIILRNARKDDERATIFKIKQMLKDGQIIVNSRCTWVIREFGLFSWHERKIDTPKDADNDCLDAIRYIINDYPTPLKLNTNPNIWTPEAIKTKYWEEVFSEPVNNKKEPRTVGWGTGDGNFFGI